MDKFRIGFGPMISIVADDTSIVSNDQRFEEKRKGLENGIYIQPGNGYKYAAFRIKL